MERLFRFSFLVIILFSLSVKCTSILSAEINKVNIGWEVYIIKVDVGDPQITYKLQASFEHDDIIFWRDLSITSTTWSDDLGGSDIIQVDGKFHRLPIILDIYGRTSLESKCLDCSGIIGLSSKSILWKIWPEMSFSVSKLSLGEMNDVISSNNKDSVLLIECKDSTGLCKTEGEISFGHSIFRNLSIIIDPSIQGIIMPPKIHDRYILGKDIYKDDISKFPNIEINIKPEIEKKSDAVEFVEHLNSKYKTAINQKGLKKNQKLIINPQTLVKYNEKNGKNFLLKRGNQNNENVITVGTESMKQLVFHKRSPEFVVVQNFITFDDLPVENYLLFLTQLILSILWKSGHIDLFKHRRATTSSFFDKLDQFLGISITIVSLVLPQNLEILKENSKLFYGTIAIVSFSIFIYIARILSVEKILKYNFTDELNDFELNAIESFSYEMIVLSGLWVLLLQYRVENNESIFLLIVNIWVLYTTSVYFSFLTHYLLSIFIFNNFPEKSEEKVKTLKTKFERFIQQKKRKYKKTFFIFISFSAVVYAYQALATLQIFLPPLLAKNLKNLDYLQIPISIAFYLFVMLVTEMIVTLLISVASSPSDLPQKNK